MFPAFLNDALSHAFMASGVAAVSQTIKRGNLSLSEEAVENFGGTLTDLFGSLDVKETFGGNVTHMLGPLDVKENFGGNVSHMIGPLDVKENFGGNVSHMLGPLDEKENFGVNVSHMLGPLDVKDSFEGNCSGMPSLLTSAANYVAGILRRMVTAERAAVNSLLTGWDPSLNASRDVDFLLYTKKNSGGVNLRSRNITSTTFNSSNPTRILLHFYYNEPNSEMMTLLKQVLLGKDDFNVVVVDWFYGAGDIHHLNAKLNVVAAETAKFIDSLIANNLATLDQIVIVGHSLGGHTAGLTDEKVTSGKVKAVIAVDPDSTCSDLIGSTDLMENIGSIFRGMLGSCSSAAAYMNDFLENMMTGKQTFIEFLLNGRDIPFNASRNVHFLLYTKKNSEGVNLRSRNIASTTYNSSNATRIILHLYYNGINLETNTLLNHVLLAKDDVNVIVVYWSYGSGDLSYLKLHVVAAQIAKFIDSLVANNFATLDQIAIVGHSLGGHTAGLAGKKVTSGKVKTVIAVDPDSTYNDLIGSSTLMGNFGGRFGDKFGSFVAILGYLPDILINISIRFSTTGNFLLTGQDPFFNASRDVHFLLYTNKDSDGVEVSINNIASTTYNASNPTRFIIHGFINGPNSEVNTALKQVYLAKGDLNIIVVDWSYGAIDDYVNARLRVNPVAAQIAKFIDSLVSNSLTTLDQVVIVGHSLGAHTAGLTGKKVTSGKIQAIIALDPAGPLFSSTPNKTTLQATDAQYVEAIHTNGGLLGMKAPCAQADFYVNGGSGQKGSFDAYVGPHTRAFEYFAESIINDQFRAVQCVLYSDVPNLDCTDKYDDYYYMSSEPPNSGMNGVFFLETHGHPPYALG